MTAATAAASYRWKSGRHGPFGIKIFQRTNRGVLHLAFVNASQAVR